MYVSGLVFRLIRSATLFFVAKYKSVQVRVIWLIVSGDIVEFEAAVDVEDVEFNMDDVEVEGVEFDLGDVRFDVDVEGVVFDVADDVAVVGILAFDVAVDVEGSVAFDVEDDAAVDADVIVIEMDEVEVLANKSAAENNSRCIIGDSGDDMVH